MTEPGVITDEGVERLRARIGVPEPHPQPPHYYRPNTDAFRNVAVAYGDDNPLWCDPAYGPTTRWESAIAPPPLVGGDTLIGEDEVTAVDPAEVRDLMKGDPLRGVHAFYSASAREWWAPLFPDRRVLRRNALVGVHDKSSEFAERAVHEWSGQVFREADGPILSAQYRLMIRTERRKARERKKYETIELGPYTNEQIEAIDAQYASEAARERAALVGGRAGRRRRRPHREGAAHRHRHDLLARRHGHGPVRRQAAAARCPQPARIPSFFFRDDLNVPDVQQRLHWDRARVASRQPDHLRLRPDARDVAHPPVHRLDGRRRVAVEARLPVPPVQLRGRHAVAGRHGDPQVPRRRQPARRSTSTSPPPTSVATRPLPGTPRSSCPAASTARSGSRTPPAARPISNPRSSRSPMTSPHATSDRRASGRRRHGALDGSATRCGRGSTSTCPCVARRRRARRCRGDPGSALAPRLRGSGTRCSARRVSSCRRGRWPTAGSTFPRRAARAVDLELRPYNLGRLNPLGLNLCAPALFAYGTEEQRLRYLPKIVRNEEVWCQLFSEPGAGSDLASLATRAERGQDEEGRDEWVVTGQKVWTTWAHLADYGVLLARTDADVPKRNGLTYFLVDLHQPGVDVRPLQHIGGEVDFNEVFLDGARVPDAQRVGEIGEGWKVAGATLSGERQMVSGEGSGGVDRIGGSGTRRLLDLARQHGSRRRRFGAPGAHAGGQRGAHPRLDQPARARGAQGGPVAPAPRARSARCTRAR